MTAVVTGNANLRVAAKQFTRFSNVTIALAQMQAVGLQALGQSNAVVHDKRDVMRSANGLQRLRKSRRFMLTQFFNPKLERRDGASGQGSLKMCGKIAAYIKRRDQV
jgi:hypothetical protein